MGIGFKMTDHINEASEKNIDKLAYDYCKMLFPNKVITAHSLEELQLLDQAKTYISCYKAGFYMAEKLQAEKCCRNCNRFVHDSGFRGKLPCGIYSQVEPLIKMAGNNPEYFFCNRWQPKD